MNGFDRRPVIGITAEGRDSKGNTILPGEYTDAVTRAGGLPVILPPWDNDAAALLDRLDGLILAGGGDMDPTHYGGSAHPAIYEVDAERDLFEMTLARRAAIEGLPTLGICRGAQVINVALGGTLHAHLPDLQPAAVAHRDDPPAYLPHPVRVEPGSRLALILAEDIVSPLSWHHQAIRHVALRLTVTARAGDGCIEAVEMAGHPFCLAVQWHPEMTAATDSAQQRLFDALVEAARAPRSLPSPAAPAGQTEWS